MLTVEQVKAHAELSVKSLVSEFRDSYKLKVSYLKNGKICRLSDVDYFPLSLIEMEKPKKEKWDEDRVKSLIPIDEWEIFTRFVNDNEDLAENDLLLWPEVKAYMENHKGDNLGSYKMLHYGAVEDIDVQANVGAIYNMAVEACKVF